MQLKREERWCKRVELTRALRQEKGQHGLSPRLAVATHTT